MITVQCKTNGTTKHTCAQAAVVRDTELPHHAGVPFASMHRRSNMQALLKEKAGAG